MRLIVGFCLLVVYAAFSFFAAFSAMHPHGSALNDVSFNHSGLGPLNAEKLKSLGMKVEYLGGEYTLSASRTETKRTVERYDVPRGCQSEPSTPTLLQVEVSCQSQSSVPFILRFDDAGYFVRFDRSGTRFPGFKFFIEYPPKHA